MEQGMSSEPENLVLAHLRELRAEFHEMHSDLAGRLERLDDRMKRMEANGRAALTRFMGHRSMAERSFAASIWSSPC
jgi:hypothetical protein